jgi:Spy/CpxP family protein refolding chaperone
VAATVVGRVCDRYVTPGVLFRSPGRLFVLEYSWRFSTMLRRFAFVAALVLPLASRSLAAPQLPPVGPRLMLHTIMTSAIVTDEQKAQIKVIVDQQKPDIQAALSSSDQMALRKALQPVMQEILNTLTPEQRQAVRAAVQKQLQDLSLTH